MLTAVDICAIIRTCAKNGVSEFAFGELLVRFGGDRLLEPQKVKANERLQEEVRLETLEKDEVMAKEEQLAIMQIEDPVGYERFLMSEDVSEPKEGLNEEYSRPE